jgi:CHAT domain-containing protein
MLLRRAEVVGTLPARWRAPWVALALPAILCACRDANGLPGSGARLAIRARWARSLAPARLTTGRLVGFPYAPPGTRPILATDAAIRLRHLVEASDVPDKAAEKALLSLAFRHPLGEAIARLERSRQLAPRDAILASDLAALYLDQAASDDRPQALFLALRSADTACRLAPRLAEARFNLGLALESLSLFEAAKRTFAEYLALDRSPGWAAEASTHLARLAQPRRSQIWQSRKMALDDAAASGDTVRVRNLISGYLEQARWHLEQDLLPAWAKSPPAPPAAQSALRASRVLATALTALAPDTLLDESVAAIESAAHDPARLAALAEGHRLYAEASRLFGRSETDAARSAFTRAERVLEQAGSPFHLMAAHLIAACDFRQSRYDAVLKRLDRLSATPGIDRYPGLRGRNEWIRGLIEYSRGSVLVERQTCKAALAAFQRAGEAGNQAKVESLLAETYDVLGEEEEAYRHQLLALRGADDIIETRRSQGIERSAADMMLRAPEPRAALYFENEAVRLATSSGNGVQITNALRDEAQLLHGVGDQERAVRAISAARANARRVGDDVLTADVLLTEAQVLATDRPREALADLSAALPLVVKTHYGAALADLYHQRGRLHLRAGDREQAAADLRAGIEQIESLSTGLDDDSRLHYLERSVALFDDMVGLEVDSEAGARPAAFRFAERSRGRSLAALMAGAGSEPVRSPELAEVAHGLPEGVVLVEYAVLPDRVIAWVLTAQAARAIILAQTSAELAQAVRRLREEIADGSQPPPTAAELYRALIAPLGLGAGAKLAIVPDKWLYQVPFAALRDAATDRYLIEDHAIEIAPSASVYLRCIREAKLRRVARQSAGSVLVVADPAFNRSLAPSLPRLPGAAAEAAAIGRLYARTEVLAGSEATPSRVLRGIGGHRIVHYAGHAEAQGSSALLAHLFLAPEARDSGVVFARDLYGRSFPSTELIVLSACDTGAVSGSEGISGLARPFLAAGVPGVIASSWRIDDATTAAFSSELHRHLRGGEEPAAALRGATLKLLRSPSSDLAAPRTWAAFVLFGTGTTLKGGSEWPR